MSDTDAERIPTNLRTMLILEAIGTQSEPMTAAEVGRLDWLAKANRSSAVQYAGR